MTKRVFYLYPVLAVFLVLGLAFWAQADSFVTISDAELAKHVGQRVSVRGQWGRPSFCCVIVDKVRSTEIFIHAPFGANVNDTTETKEDQVRRKQWCEQFQFDDPVMATGLLYRYDMVQKPIGDVSNAIPPHHFYLDSRSVTIRGHVP